MRVMIVDDERLALRQFVMETEDIPDIEVAGAFSNPLQALEYLKENPVEAVFLDIEMPELNGIILAEKMRELYSDLVVIFITGYEQYTLDALKVKADYYMTKPYDSGQSCYLPGREKEYTYGLSGDLISLSTERLSTSPIQRQKNFWLSV